MERIAAIVEGHVEAFFMEASYPRAKVQRCIPNGDDVSIEVILDTIIDRVSILDDGIKKVIILFDRERRSKKALDIIDHLKSALRSFYPEKTFYIGVADREIENWILADCTFVQQKFSASPYKYCGDGVEGKRHLKKITKFELAPRDKALLLKATSPSRASEKSNSLSHFISQIDFNWAWALK